MREYEVVFNVYGYTQLWYHSVGSVSYSRKIERKDGRWKHYLYAFGKWPYLIHS